MNTLSKFINDESGATMIEYASLVSFVAVVAWVTFPMLSATIKDSINRVSFVKNNNFGL